jgi:hypothetical protein
MSRAKAGAPHGRRAWTFPVVFQKKRIDVSHLAAADGGVTADALVIPKHFRVTGL